MTIFELIENAELAAILSELKKEPNAALQRNKDGFTPLIKLAMRGPSVKDPEKFFDSIVSALLKEHDLEVIAATDYLTGRTALHWACVENNIHFYRALYKHTGLQTWWYHRDFGGKTPVALARENGFLVLMEEMELGRSKRVGRGRNKLAIIGMGPAGSALFVRLVKRLAWTGERYGKDFPKSIRFDLYDKGLLGQGTPYDPRKTSDTSLLNVAAAGMSIDADNPMDFVGWVKELELQGTLREKLGAAAELGLCPASARVDGYYPRTFYGKYLVERLESFIAKANELGIEVVRHPMTEVISVSEGKDGYEVTSRTDGKNHVDTAAFVYYTTGHFTQKEKDDKKDDKEHRALTECDAYIDTPINASDLEKRGVFNGKECKVAVLGSSLSAVDVIFSLLLHKDVGTLSWNGQKPVYTLHKKGFKVSCYSRKGLFSKVRPSSNRDIDLKFLSPYDVASRSRPLYQQGQQGTLSVKELVEALEKDLASHLPELKIDIAKGEHKGLIDKLQDPYEYWKDMKHDPFEYLKGDIEWADDGQDKAGNVGWYQVMHSLFPVVRPIYRQFTTQQRAEFASRYGSLFLWAFAPMPLRSARTLLAMHEAGALDLYRVEGSPKVQGKKIRISYKENTADAKVVAADHDFLCSTIGLHSTFHLDSSELTVNSKAKTDDFDADADFVFYDPYSLESPPPGNEPKKPEQERTAWMADDGTFELAMVRNKKTVHTPARRGVGYFLQDQINDVQAVPSVVKYSTQVAELYYDEFVHRAGKSVVTGGDLRD